MKKTHTLLFISLLCFTAFTVFAQSNRQVENSPEARLIDDFDELGAEALSARLDQVAVALQNNPQSRAYIIVYHLQGKSYGFPYRYAARIKTYLVQQRGFDSDRIIT
jgi:hypothetical protein